MGLLFQEASLSCLVFFFPFGVEFSVLDSLLCLLLWSEREGKRVFFVLLLRVCLLGVYVYVFLFSYLLLLFPFGTSIIWIQKKFGGSDLFISLTDAAFWKIILFWFY